MMVKLGITTSMGSLWAHSHTVLCFREALEVLSSHHEGRAGLVSVARHRPAPADVLEMPSSQGSLFHAGDVHPCCLGVGSVSWSQGSLCWPPPPLPAGWETVT